MSIAETSMRAAVGRAITLIDSLLQNDIIDRDAIDDDSDGSFAGYLRGLAFARQHDLDIIRRELADYLPEPDTCGCGNPSVGRDVTGAPICAHCSALAAQAMEQIPTQPSGSDR